MEQPTGRGYYYLMVFTSDRLTSGQPEIVASLLMKFSGWNFRFYECENNRGRTFDPHNTGTAVIYFSRSLYDAITGTATPRLLQQTYTITYKPKH